MSQIMKIKYGRMICLAFDDDFMNKLHRKATSLKTY